MRTASNRAARPCARGQRDRGPQGREGRPDPARRRRQLGRRAGQGRLARATPTPASSAPCTTGLRPVPEAAVGAVKQTLHEQGLPAAGGMTFLQARTANEVLKAQERRLRLQQLKGELVDRARAVSLVFRLARDERDAWSGWPARIAAVLAAELGCDTHAPADRPGPPCPRAARRSWPSPASSSAEPDGCRRPGPGLGPGPAPRAGPQRRRLGRPAPGALAARLGRARPLAHRAHALPAARSWPPCRRRTRRSGSCS